MDVYAFCMGLFLIYSSLNYNISYSKGGFKSHVIGIIIMNKFIQKAGGTVTIETWCGMPS